MVGRPTGLVSGAAMSAKIEERKKQVRDKFEKMDPNLSGKEAETVIRDRRGE